MLASIAAFLQRGGAFPAPDLALIEAAWEPRQLAAGESLVEAGQICRELFFVQQGVARILAPQPDGRQVVYHFVQENQLCTVLASYTGQVPATTSIQAACPMQVLAIRKGQLEALCQQLPYLAGRMQQLQQQGLLDKMAIQQAYLGLDSAARYQQFLARQPGIALRVPLADVASYLGITPQSLSRIRKNSR